MDSQWLLSSLLTIWLPSTYPPDPNVFRLHLHRCTKTPQKISAQLSGLVDCYTIHLYPIHLRITLVVNISFFWSLSISYLVGGFNRLEKYESQWEGLSHIFWKIKGMFETTNQLSNFLLTVISSDFVDYRWWISPYRWFTTQARLYTYYIMLSGWIILIHKAAKYCHHTAMWGWFPI